MYTLTNLLPNLLFPLLLLLLLLLAPSSAASRCDFSCNFRLCKTNGLTGFQNLRTPGPRVNLRRPYDTSNPFVCLPESNLTSILRIGEARVKVALSEHHLVNLTHFESPASRVRFPPRYFDLTPLNTPPVPGKFGLSRSRSSPSMARALDDVCVVIPIREYGITNSHGLEQIVQSNDEKDCVSYRVLAPKLLVSFSWNTSDDFDLSVKEPGLHGFEMSRFDKRAPSGGHLINDNNSGFCGLALAGREQVVYQQDAELTNGTYSVSVRHFKNCRRGASAWKLDVTLASGTRLLTLLGVSNEKQSLKPIFNVAFTV